ncbi:MAG: hypothetical protein ACQEXK_18855 [Bacillota bacterium]
MDKKGKKFGRYLKEKKVKAVQMYLNGEGSNETKGTKSIERYQSVIIIKYRLKKEY